MLTFNCANCGKKYSVDDKLAGKKAKCKACGAAIVVPKPQLFPPSFDDDVDSWLRGDDVMDQEDDAPLASSSPPRTRSGAVPKKQKLPVRTRRLVADANLLATAFRNFPLIKIAKREGNPPDRYQIIYNVRGLARGPEGNPIFRDGHVAEIQLTSDYPRQSPKCRMLTPIFHPNIEPSTICVGDHWTAGERLVDLVIRIGEMIAYQAYNIKSPLDGDAAMWADKNPQHLPVDRRDLRPPDLD